MPTPRENTLALIKAGAFLLEVSQEPEFPIEYRRRAQGIVDQFPSVEQIRRASKEAGALPLEGVNQLALDAYQAEPLTLLTDAAKSSWQDLRKALQLSGDEKTKLGEDFLSHREMQALVGLDEGTLSHRSGLRWFLAVPALGEELMFPRFQIFNGKPIDAACEVFSLFDRYANGWDDPWLIVAWFYRANSRLKGKSPVEILITNGETVVQAAAADLAVDRLED